MARLSTAHTLARASSEPPAPALPAPLAAVEPEPAPEPPPRTPERQRLAEAIETVHALEREVVTASASIEPARDAVWAAQRVLSDAEAVLKDARPRDAYSPPPTSSYSYWGSAAENEEAQRRARAAAEAPPISVADAKAAVEVAQDALDSAMRARQWHEDRLRTAEQRLESSRSSIRTAVRAILRSDPAVLALAMECRRRNTRAEAARTAFREILWGDVVQPGSPFYGWDSVPDARTSPEAMEDWSVSRDWRDALAALATDADAPLPAV